MNNLTQFARQMMTLASMNKLPDRQRLHRLMTIYGVTDEQRRLYVDALNATIGHGQNNLNFDAVQIVYTGFARITGDIE